MPATRLLCCLTCASLMFLAGCEKPPGSLLAVSGTVSLAGQPLDQGTIQFIRDEPPAELVGGAMIREGSYTLPVNHGLAAGRYKVLISSPELSPEPDASAAMRSTQPHKTKQRIPPEYNTESQVFVEVRPDALNQFNFSIP